MVAGYGLTVEDTSAPKPGRLETVGEVAMDQGCQLDQGAPFGAGKGRVLIGRLARPLGVDADDVQEAGKIGSESLQSSSGLRGNGMDRESRGEHLTHDL